MTYQEINSQQPVLEKVFFAFSNEQFAEGKKKIGVTDNKDLLKGFGGCFGTKQGLKDMADFYEDRAARIKNECSPQDVYEYEFGNHECSYTCDDSEAMEIVIDYFGKDRAKEVQRKYGYRSIDSFQD